ncbi:MAG: glycyl-radical enzyme activating protein [Clostridia bacterium]|nr:glycyl-radical enzyme activating protein [Clostridia bacterium]
MNTVSDVKGKIFDIQRFCLHDGPGIRTTVFLKGCPLKCAWCHNPESWKKDADLFYHASACICCAECVAVCKSGAHSISDGMHLFDRAKCVNCFACAAACPTGALETVGQEMTVEEVIKTVLRDLPFYKEEGGMTVSGGEPFGQSEFLIKLLSTAKREGLHTCVETSGASHIDNMIAAKEYTDIFLYDLKMMPGEKHKRYIGIDGTALHDNLKQLDKSGARIILRCPIIPNVNDNSEHFSYIACLANSLENLLEVHIQPYHTTGIPKAIDIGKKDIFTVEDFDAKAFKEHIKNNLLPLVSNAVKMVRMY